MFEPTHYHSHRPVDATAVVVDLRNFTPNLKMSMLDEQGKDPFCEFMAQLHAVCLDACLLALPVGQRRSPPFFIGSTGDGAIMTFTDPRRHPAHGYLAALLLHRRLGALCEDWNGAGLSRKDAPLSFGIGIESGSVTEIVAGSPSGGGAPTLRTVLGSCINIAARAQGVTKQLACSRTIMSCRALQLLTRLILGADYASLQQASARREGKTQEKRAAEDRMAELNRKLCLRFLHLHHLRGVDEPVPLFRVSENALSMDNPAFTGLLERLVEGEPGHFDQIIALLG